jgi:hypothetical protein
MAKPRHALPFFSQSQVYRYSRGGNVLLTDVKFKLANKTPYTDNMFYVVSTYMYIKCTVISRAWIDIIL